MQTRSLRHPLFETSHQNEILSSRVIWIAILAAFVVANAPPKILVPVIFDLLRLVPQDWLIGITATNDLRTISQSIVLLVIVPVKKLSFFIALLVIGYPVIRSLIESAPFWRRVHAKRLAWSALLLFICLSILAVPYANPNGPFVNRSGLPGLGVLRGEMSLAPFASSNDFVYGRLLKPAIAHFIHMDGYARYYLLSLICTYLLVFLTLVFLESKIMTEAASAYRSSMIRPAARWLVYLSVMTSSFVITSFQWPGIVDHLLFLFVLLMACVPMTPHARLGTVALCTLTHEAITLALVPIILFWFPRKERSTTLLVIASFYGIMAASYGLNLSHALRGHGTTVNEGSVWQVIFHHPGYALTGLFFSYKLIWVVFFYVLWQCGINKASRPSLELATITLFPIVLCFLACG